MKCTFVVGQKVVCITKEWYLELQGALSAKNAGCLPQYGQIYKITGFYDFEGEIYLFLDGHDPDVFRHGAFRALNQRPTATDISVFHVIRIQAELERELAKVVD